MTVFNGTINTEGERNNEYSCNRRSRIYRSKSGSVFSKYVSERSDLQLGCIDYAGNLESLIPVEDKPNYHFIHMDITDRPAIFQLFEENLTSSSMWRQKATLIARFRIRTSSFRRILVEHRYLLDASREYGVTRFHQVSTDEVYGDLPLDRPDLFLQKIRRFRLQVLFCFQSFSGLVNPGLSQNFKLSITISRCSNNYGPYQFPEKLIPLVISRALNDETIPVYGKGENVQDWLHVIDHCRAIDRIVQDGKIG